VRERRLIDAVAALGQLSDDASVNGERMTKAAWFRPVIFSVNCYIATILTLFIAFSLDLKSPAWAMTTVYLTRQPISGAMRAKGCFEETKLPRTL